MAKANKIVNNGEDCKIRMEDFDNCPIGREIRLQMKGLSKDVQYIKKDIAENFKRTDNKFDCLFAKIDEVSGKFAEKEQVKDLETKLLRLETKTNALTNKAYAAIVGALFSILLVILTYFLNN